MPLLPIMPSVKYLLSSFWKVAKASMTEYLIRFLLFFIF